MADYCPPGVTLGDMTLPDCETDMDFEEDEVDEGETVSCTECGAEFEVVSTSPLELSKVSDDDDDDDEDDDDDKEE